MSIPKADRWMQVDWNSGGRSVVNVRYLLKSLPSGVELNIGTVVTIGKQECGAPLTATVLRSARERHLLEDLQPTQEETRDTDAGATAQKAEQKEQEHEDYSPSASDWEPTEESSSDDSEEEDDKKPKLERSKMRQYINKTGRRVLTPTHRPNAVIPNGMQQLAIQNLMNRKSQCDVRKYGKALPDSTKKTKQNDPKESVNELINSMKDMFNELFKILSEVKPSFNINDITDIDLKSKIVTGMDLTDNTHDNSEYCQNTASGYVKNEMNNTEVDERMDSEYSDRSDDNVLITNKYDTVNKNSDKNVRGEWVPIGSGTTLIHKDKFRKVNWKSYTIATRTLLLAAFSRKTLATHSLTGKKSPAFSYKPAKMCLDPKIVSDIVIEITDKFKVKDNLVRSIITTKCADECKMQKMKQNKSGIHKKKGKNQENIPPAASNTTV